MNKRGVTLIEVLLSIVIVAIASIATLTYFAYAKGGVGKTGNRRAALERARQRLEQMLAANISGITPFGSTVAGIAPARRRPTSVGRKTSKHVSAQGFSKDVTGFDSNQISASSSSPRSTCEITRTCTSAARIAIEKS